MTDCIVSSEPRTLEEVKKCVTTGEEPGTPLLSMADEQTTSIQDQKALHGIAEDHGVETDTQM